MATDWKLASPEQIAARNAKRREAYAKLDLEKKLAVQKAAKEQGYKRKKPTVPRTSWLQQPDGTWKELTHLDWVKWIDRKKKKMDAHKKVFMAKLDRYQAWQRAGGLFPWPNLQDKAEVSKLFVRIMHLLGRKCCHCQDWKMFDFSWRLTRKDDFLAFVPFRKDAYEKVLKNIDQYCVYCLRCAFDLRIYTFAWIFDPRSPRNNPNVTRYTFGDKYPNWHKYCATIYPPSRELFDRIRDGRVKSLTCGIIGPDGHFMETFIRKNQYYGWVGSQPRDFSWHTLDQARHFYTRLNPSADVSFWGAGDESGRDLSFETTKWDALGEDTRRFLREVKPAWEKLRERPILPQRVS